MKGAPEIVLQKCSNHFNSAGQREDLSQVQMEYLTTDIISKEMTSEGLRTLAFSFRDFAVEEFEALKAETHNFTTEGCEAFLEEHHCFLALIALKDPIRDQVPNCVKYARKGRINVRMVTNNSLETAKTVAADCGILDEHVLHTSPEIQRTYAMEAAEFRALVGGIETGYD